MKKYINIIVALAISFSLQANTAHPKYVDKATYPVEINTVDNINLLSIKADIDNNRRAYFMTGSVTVLQAPKTGDVASSLDLSFRNSPVLSRKGSTYIQANPQAKRNDTDATNEIRIYVHHDTLGKGDVDASNVKLNWKSGATGEIVGKLSNVTVLYQKDSILITGSFQKNGYTLGVSLAIAKEVKLI